MLGYQGKNKVRNLSEFGLNLLSNTVCALAGNFLPSQNFEHGFWHKIKEREKLY
jgi:hypothetical protein